MCNWDNNPPAVRYGPTKVPMEKPLDEAKDIDKLIELLKKIKGPIDWKPNPNA